MPKSHILLFTAQLFLLIHLISSNTDLCISNFETKKSQLCSQLGTSENPCYFINDECMDWFNECAEYSPSNNFDDNICQKITPSNKLKKCQVQTTSETKACIEVDKACEDFTDSTCLNLNLGEDKRCVFKNSKCEEHFYSCEGLLEEKCSQNIPSSNSQRCSWDTSTSSCVSQDRKCEDFIEYTEKGKKNLQCNALKSESPKICFMYGNNCVEEYKTCSQANDKTSCEKTIPKYDFDLSFSKSFTKCVWESEACVEKDRTCSDYKKRESDDPTYCNSFKSEKEENKKYKVCSINYKTDTCEEIYKSCEAYNSVISKDERKEEDCIIINPGSTTKKCAFDKEKKECKEVYKDCEDINSRNSCILHKLENANKYCIFDNNLCIEHYKTCEAYDEEFEEDKRNKEDCEAIIPFYSGGSYQCIFTEEKKCEKKKLETCEDYDGTLQYLCEQISPPESSTYRCAMKDKKCFTEYKTCYSYKNQENINNKERCESIILDTSYDKCLYENNMKSCYPAKKTCEEFFDSSDEECASHQVSDYNAECVHENNKCVEKTKYVYDYCNLYTGKDKKICEAIIPRSAFNRNSILYGQKCVIGQYGCTNVDKECSEAKDEKECYSITVSSSSNKECLFIDNTCKEQYKSCILYETNESTLNKETCESIVLKDDNKNKCVFTEGKDGAKGTCRTSEKKCADFNINLLAKQCFDLSSSLPIDTKKCSFKDNICKTVDKKTCAELSQILVATEEDCKTATTSSPNIKCIFKSRTCEEVSNHENTGNNDKDKDDNSSDNKSSDKTNDDKDKSSDSSNNNNDGGNNGNKDEDEYSNYSRKENLNKILLILLCVLV